MEDINNYLALREELREYLKELRRLSRINNTIEPNMLNKVIFIEDRKGFFNKEYVERLVLFLRGTGCSLATETGGCTFCGFYNATNFGIKIRDEDYISQISEVLSDKSINLDNYPILSIYNDGSMLKEEEISFDTTIQIMKLINSKENIKKIVFESRVEDITEEKAAQLRAATDKNIEIAVGFESANPIVRDLCINKSFKNSKFEESLRILKKYDISLIPLMILKPPFLTENEAIDDYVNSLKYLEKFNLKRIDMELPTVEKYTLVHELWKQEKYTPAKLWSVIEILKIRHSLGFKTPIYISPSNYSVSAEAKASNCPKCDTKIYNAFEYYNNYGDVSIFNDIQCSCRKEWANSLKCKFEQKTIPERITEALQLLGNKE